MRYFRIFDDLAPEGDLYRHTGTRWECVMPDGTWAHSYAGRGLTTDWLDRQVEFGKNAGFAESRWEEINEPA
jgi:hypothetical protein